MTTQTRNPPPPRLAEGPTGSRERDRQGIAKRLSLDYAALEAIDALRRVGIPSILLKGPVTAARLYGDDYRSYVDIDLLVPIGVIEVALDVLERHGYRRRGSTAIEYDLHRPRDLASIDLHVTLAGAEVIPEVVWQVCSRHATAFHLHGHRVVALDEGAHACHLAMHAAVTGGVNLKPGADLQRAVRKLSAGAWCQAAAVARGLGTTHLLVAGLRCYSDGGGVVADDLGLETIVRKGSRVRSADWTGLTHIGHVWRGSTWPQRVTLIRRWCFPHKRQLADRLSRDTIVQRLPNYTPVWLQLLLFRGHQLAGLLSAVKLGWSRR